MSQKSGFIHLLLVIFILLLGVLAFLVFSKSRVKTQPVESTMSSDSKHYYTGDWKTYTSNNYLFSIKYPPTWSVSTFEDGPHLQFTSYNPMLPTLPPKGAGSLSLKVNWPVGKTHTVSNSPIQYTQDSSENASDPSIKVIYYKAVVDGDDIQGSAFYSNDGDKLVMEQILSSLEFVKKNGDTSDIESELDEKGKVSVIVNIKGLPASENLADTVLSDANISSDEFSITNRYHNVPSFAGEILKKSALDKLKSSKYVNHVGLNLTMHLF